jgi:hypothetical protein
MDFCGSYICFLKVLIYYSNLCLLYPYYSKTKNQYYEEI